MAGNQLGGFGAPRQQTNPLFAGSPQSNQATVSDRAKSFGRLPMSTQMAMTKASFAHERFQLKEYSLQFGSNQATSEVTNGTEYDIHREPERKFILKRFAAVCREAQKHAQNSQHQEAIDKYVEGLKMNQLPYYMVGYAHCMIGNEYMKQKKFDHALVNFENHFTVATNVKDITMVVNALINVGTAKYQLGKFDDARRDLKNALFYSMDTTCTFPDDPQGFLGPRKKAQMKIFANLGNSYGAQSKFMEALKMHEKQLQIATEWVEVMEETGQQNLAEPPKLALARAEYNLENDYNSLGRYDEAKKHRDLKLKYFSDASNQASNMNHSVLANKTAVNQGMGEFKHNSDIYSGWMMKHEGGEGPSKGPSTVKRTKRWCSLSQSEQLGGTGMVFAYYKDVKAAQRADRYLPLSEVVEVPYAHHGTACLYASGRDCSNDPIWIAQAEILVLCTPVVITPLLSASACVRVCACVVCS